MLVLLCSCERYAFVGLSKGPDRPGPPTDKNKFVHVQVLNDGRTCGVGSAQMRCDVVAAYLKDDLYTDLSESVIVGAEGTGKAAIARADEVRWNLKAAGYSDVWTIGFLTSPDHPNPDP